MLSYWFAKRLLQSLNVNFDILVLPTLFGDSQVVEFELLVTCTTFDVTVIINSNLVTLRYM